jgi:serpin B
MFQKFTCLTLALVLYATPVLADENEDLKQVVQGNTDFALSLYQQIRSKEGNLFVSPYSISTALAMTYAGARDNTAVEMARVLHFNVNPDRLHPAMGALIRNLNERKRTQRRRNDPDSDKKPFELSIANALWGQNGYSFEKPFLDLTRDSYGAGLKQMDFQNQPEKSRLEINRWVEEQTQDKIKDLIAEGALKKDTRLVLTNAIYFKSSWATPFDTRWTRKETFHLDPTRKVTVPMMHRSADFKAHDAGTHTVLSLPYKGHLEMVLIVPKEIDGLSKVEKTLTPETLSGWMEKLGRSTRYDLGLPRFKTTATLDLKETLQEMGMNDAFDRSTANLRGLSRSIPELYIDKMMHKAFVDVDESGTEAAASTYGNFLAKGVPKTPVPLQVDRPFLFLIRDQQTGSILFMGRILDPR